MRMVSTAAFLLAVQLPGPGQAQRLGRLRAAVQSMRSTLAKTIQRPARARPAPPIHDHLRHYAHALADPSGKRGRFVAPTKVPRYQVRDLDTRQLQGVVDRLKRYSGSKVVDCFNAWSRGVQLEIGGRRLAAGEHQTANIGATGFGHSRTNSYQGRPGNVLYRIGIWARDASGKPIPHDQLQLVGTDGRIRAPSGTRFTVHLYGEEVGWTNGSTLSRILVGQDAPVGQRVVRPHPRLPVGLHREPRQ